MNNTYAKSRYFPWLLGLSFLIAFSCTAPFRDLYGIEARNGLMVKEMLRGGIGFIPHVMGRPYPDYPPLYFWLAMLFSKLSGGVSTLATILPSALSGAGLVVITLLLGSYLSLRMGIVSALVLGTFPEFWFKASRATIDMLLAFEIALALFLLWKARYSESSVQKKKLGFVAAVSVLAALLTKGPVGVVLIGVIWASYLVITGKLKEFAVFLGLYTLLVSSCVVIYLALVWHQGGMDLVKDVVRSQVLGRLGGAPNKSLLFYEKYILEAAGPWWFWVIAALYKWWKGGDAERNGDGTGKKKSSRSLMKFALIWFVVVLGIFSMASSRHGRYLLPAFPALAIIMSFFVEKILAYTAGGTATRVLEKVITGFFFAFLVGISILYFVADFPGKVSAMWALVWIVILVLLWLLKERVIIIPHGVFTKQVVCSWAILSGITLLVFPIISHRESGRSFVENVEAKIPENIPIILFKIKQDGDGIKYALHSNRPSSALKFIFRTKELAFCSRPCLLVAYKKDVEQLLAVGNSKKVKLLGEGLIHHKPVVAYLLGEGSV
ncbi:MAG: glycosyltransferase family 39 protein [Deltaproteobacteria bacterium]|nr:glycosyltransferase family 39 protein [Deltaproteobacteria bacterium]